MMEKLTIEEVEAMNGEPVWCEIPSDNPAWGIVDAMNKCVVLGRWGLLAFDYYGEWKAYKKDVH